MWVVNFIGTGQGGLEMRPTATCLLRTQTGARHKEEASADGAGMTWQRGGKRVGLWANERLGLASASLGQEEKNSRAKQKRSGKKGQWRK